LAGDISKKRRDLRLIARINLAFAPVNRTGGQTICINISDPNLKSCGFKGLPHGPTNAVAACGD
jgi:hypothetical protein